MSRLARVCFWAGAVVVGVDAICAAARSPERSPFDYSIRRHSSRSSASCSCSSSAFDSSACLSRLFASAVRVSIWFTCRVVTTTCFPGISTFYRLISSFFFENNHWLSTIFQGCVCWVLLYIARRAEHHYVHETHWLLREQLQRR